MKTYIVKWHIIDISKRQPRVDSGVLQVKAADQLDAVILTRKSLAIVNWKLVEFYIDEVREIAS